jgi:TRAP-type C4-dicarboxylate transport system permease small subunit
VKALRIVLIIIASLLTLFQLFGYVALIADSHITSEEVTGSDLPNKIAYYVGYNLPLVAAMICFFVAYRLKRKIKRRSMEVVVESIGRESNVHN